MNHLQNAVHAPPPRTRTWPLYVLLLISFLMNLYTFWYASREDQAVGILNRRLIVVEHTTPAFRPLSEPNR